MVSIIQAEVSCLQLRHSLIGPRVPIIMGSTLCVFRCWSLCDLFSLCLCCHSFLFGDEKRQMVLCSCQTYSTLGLYLLCSCSWVCMLSDQLLTNGIILYNIPLSFFFTAFNLAGTNIWHWTFVQCTEQTEVSLQKVVYEYLTEHQAVERQLFSMTFDD